MSKAKKDILTATGLVLFGERWQTDLSRALGFSDGRRIRQWMADERPIPDTIFNSLEKLLLERKTSMDKLLLKIEKTKK